MRLGLAEPAQIAEQLSEPYPRLGVAGSGQGRQVGDRLLRLACRFVQLEKTGVGDGVARVGLHHAPPGRDLVLRIAALARAASQKLQRRDVVGRDIRQESLVAQQPAQIGTDPRVVRMVGHQGAPSGDLSLAAETP